MVHGVRPLSGSVLLVVPNHVLSAPVVAPLILLIDPFFLIEILIQDPKTFGFLNPFLILTVIRVGIRYGVRSMYLSWLATLLASTLLATSEFWRHEVELTGAFVLMLLSIPLSFADLVRRVHYVRFIEQERARIDAVQQTLVARNEFLARVSHEPRSPLQGIVSALDLRSMRRGPAAGVAGELIGRIRRSSLLLNTHLRDLLTLAKGEAGKLEMRPERFDACALLESVSSSARELAREKGLALKIFLPSAPAFVVVDPARIDQVLTNLVLNSVRYTQAGEVRLILEPYDDNERQLRFTIADTGPGIAADRLPSLLTPDRTITSSDRRGEGSGIGLAIGRTLVDHLGGSVDVTSREGVGTTFRVVVAAEPAEDGIDDEEAIDSSRGRILIVDDRAGIIDALSSVADELGFECDRATSSAVAANLLASRAF